MKLKVTWLQLICKRIELSLWLLLVHPETRSNKVVSKILTREFLQSKKKKLIGKRKPNEEEEGQRGKTKTKVGEGSIKVFTNIIFFLVSIYVKIPTKHSCLLQLFQSFLWMPIFSWSVCNLCKKLYTFKFKLTGLYNMLIGLLEKKKCTHA